MKGFHFGDVDDWDYKSDLEIDLNSLDLELIKQPILYSKYSNAWAVAIREQARAKEKLNMTRADLDAKARKSWDILGFEKRPSEPQIATWIPNQETYKDANFEYIEATYRVNILETAKWAFEQRKKSLEHLVSLYLANYFVEPKISKEARDGLNDFKNKKQSELLNEDEGLKNRLKKKDKPNKLIQIKRR